MKWSSEDWIKIRRDLHKIPEIGLKEFKTQEYLLAIIQAMKTDKVEIKTWRTAILVRVRGNNSQKVIGWRTDIDGLPIKERTELPYASIHEGYMHACGHDFHMTIALGILQNIIANDMANDFVFLFQPAEENEAGGKLVYDSGMMKEWMPDEIYGLHIQPRLPVGTVSTREGTLFAGDCEIYATFKGKEGHAAYPHLSNDMIIAATSFIQQAQTIVSRNMNPMEGAVVTIATFHSGEATNIVPGEAKISGSIRSLGKSVNELTQRRLQEIAQGIENSFQCEVELVLDQKGYLPVMNNKETTQKFIDFAISSDLVELQIAEPAMTAEDFGYLLAKIPGTMFWLGVDTPYDLHNNQLNPKEEAIQVGIDTVTAFFQKIEKEGQE